MDHQVYIEHDAVDFNITIEEVETIEEIEQVSQVENCTICMGTITAEGKIVGYGIRIADKLPTLVRQIIHHAWGNPTTIIDNGHRLVLWRLADRQETDSTWGRFRSAFVKLADARTIGLQIEREDFDQYADTLIESPGPSLSGSQPGYQQTLDVLLPPPADKPKAEPTIAQHGVTNIRTEEWKRQLPKGPKFLYMALIGHCGRTNSCMVSEERLADDCSACRQSVSRWMKYLASPDVGLVRIEPRQHWNMNRYTLPKMSPIDFKASKTYWRDKRKNARK